MPYCLAALPPAIANLVAGRPNLRNFSTLITSANGIKEIADIPASIMCSLAWSRSFLAKANPDLNVDIITLIPSAIVPYVGSKPATSKAA